MKIAVDETPLVDELSTAHRVRGTGFYIKNLKKSLVDFFPENKYFFFTRGQNLPSDIDIVHYPYFEPFFLTLPIQKAFSTVVTVHDLTPLVFPKQFPAGFRGNIRWQIQRFSLSRTSAIITDSHSSKQDIMKYVGLSDDEIHVVYLAASPNFRSLKDKALMERIRVKYKLPKKFILYVGDATWNKNLPRLLAATKKIDLPLVMVGKALLEVDFDKENPWNQDLLLTQRLAEENKEVIRLGFVPTEDLVVVYNAATVFTMPSLYEGFGLPVLEAMSTGLPVVTTKAGSLAEVAGGAAYFVDPNDIESIANGIGEVFYSKALQASLAAKSLQQGKKFSWKRTAMETIKVYETVFGKK